MGSPHAQPCPRESKSPCTRDRRESSHRLHRVAFRLGRCDGFRNCRMVAGGSGIVRALAGRAGVVSRWSRRGRRPRRADLRIVLMLGCPPLAMWLRRVHELRPLRELASRPKMISAEIQVEPLELVKSGAVDRRARRSVSITPKAKKDTAEAGTRDSARCSSVSAELDRGWSASSQPALSVCECLAGGAVPPARSDGDPIDHFRKASSRP